MRNNCHYGFSLIEVLVTCAIMSIIALCVNTFFLSSVKSFRSEDHRNAFRSDYLTFITKFRLEVRQAYKATMRLTDNANTTEIKFVYQDPKSLTNHIVGYAFSKNDHCIYRIVYNTSDWDTAAPIEQYVVLKNVQEPIKTPPVLVFKQEDNYDVIHVSVAPYGYSSIPNGAVNEMLSTIIAVRSLY